MNEKEPSRSDYSFTEFQDKVLEYFSNNRQARNHYLLKLNNTLCYLRQVFCPGDEEEKERLAVIHLATECDNLKKQQKEFIELLEEQIKLIKKGNPVNITEYTQAKLDTLEKILSQYKEITKYKPEEVQLTIDEM